MVNTYISRQHFFDRVLSLTTSPVTPLNFVTVWGEDRLDAVMPGPAIELAATDVGTTARSMAPVTLPPASDVPVVVAVEFFIVAIGLRL